MDSDRLPRFRASESERYVAQLSPRPLLRRFHAGALGHLQHIRHGQRARAGAETFPRPHNKGRISAAQGQTGKAIISGLLASTIERSIASP
jgi:hypothetical protein